MGVAATLPELSEWTLQISGPGLKVGAKPRGLPGEMLALGID